jgi:hypothetical protein
MDRSISLGTVPPCCRAKHLRNGKSVAPSGRPPAASSSVRGSHGIGSLTGSIASGIGLVLVPKCPICLAAYLAAGTGLAVPLPAAAHIRLLLVLLCVTLLLWWSLRGVRSLCLNCRLRSGVFHGHADIDV